MMKFSEGKSLVKIFSIVQYDLKNRFASLIKEQSQAFKARPLVQSAPPWMLVNHKWILAELLNNIYISIGWRLEFFVKICNRYNESYKSNNDIRFYRGKVLIFSIMYRLATVFLVSIRASSPQGLSGAPFFLFLRPYISFCPDNSIILHHN